MQGRVSNIFVTVYGGPLVTIEVSFGDGQETTYLSSDLEDAVNLTNPAHHVEVGAGISGVRPVYRYQLTHLYSTVGSYEIIINVSNHISSKSASLQMFVDEPITGIHLTTNQSRVIAINTKVIVMATVATGRNLGFDWDFGDDNPSSVRSYVPLLIFLCPHLSRVGQYCIHCHISNFSYQVMSRKEWEGEVTCMQDMRYELFVVR